MTLIVALVKNGKSYVAGDKLVTNSSGDNDKLSESKIFKFGNLLGGGCGYINHIQWMKFGVDWDKVNADLEDGEPFPSVFYGSIWPQFREYVEHVTGEPLKWDGDNGGSTFLFVWDGNIHVAAIRNLVCYSISGKCSAEGTGGEYAQGVLTTDYDKVSVPKLLEKAFQAAYKNNCFISEEYDILSV